MQVGSLLAPLLAPLLPGTMAIMPSSGTGKGRFSGFFTRAETNAPDRISVVVFDTSVIRSLYGAETTT